MLMFVTLHTFAHPYLRFARPAVKSGTTGSRPRSLEHCADGLSRWQVVAVQVGTSVVMGFSSYLMYQLHEWAWYRLFIWTFIGELLRG